MVYMITTKTDTAIIQYDVHLYKKNNNKAIAELEQFVM